MRILSFNTRVKDCALKLKADLVKSLILTGGDQISRNDDIVLLFLPFCPSDAQIFSLESKSSDLHDYETSDDVTCHIRHCDAVT